MLSLVGRVVLLLDLLLRGEPTLALGLVQLRLVVPPGLLGLLRRPGSALVLELVVGVFHFVPSAN